MNDGLQKPRVCHISTVHQANDVRIFVRECCSLAEHGFDVHLVIPAPDSERKNGVQYHAISRFSSRILRMTVAPWIALSRALKTKAQIYHYHDPELIWLGFILRWVLGKKVVYDIHESVYRQLQSKKYLPGVLGRIAAEFYRCNERLLTLGQTKIVANLGSVEDYDNPVLVQNFPRHFSMTPSRDRFAREETPLLVYVGAINELRGMMEYLKLAKMLKDESRDFKMAIIGRLGGTEIARRMQQQIIDDDLEDQVTLYGRLEWQSAMQIVADASIGLCLLHPVKNYTTCLATKIIEYMMLGTPVLASAFDCWRPYVEGEMVGRMADPLNADEVYQTCVEMLDDVEGLREMSDRGPSTVAAKYTWEQEFEKLKNCYSQLLDQ